jgi:hypothetical protein
VPSFFNWTAERLNFNNCCDCFGSDASTKFTVWGFALDDITIQPTVTRSLITLQPSVAVGQPNAKIDHIYIRADTMVGPIVRIDAGEGTQVDNFEVNVASLSPTIIQDTAGGTWDIGSIKIETGTYTAARAMCLISNSNAFIRRLLITNLTYDAATGANPYIFTASASNVRIGELQLSITVSGGNLYVFNANASSSVEVDHLEGSLPASTYISDVGGSVAPEVINIASWNNDHVSGDKGDADYTYALGDATTVRYETTLTAARTITLPSISTPNNLFNGLSITAIREALGDFKLDVVRAAPTFVDSFPPNSTGTITFTWRRSGAGAWQATKRVLRPSVYSTAVGNLGAGEDNLITFALPASFLNAINHGVRITAWGTVANNANAKTVIMYFGTIAIITTALTANQVGTWRINAVVVRTGASAQDYSAQLIQGGTTTLIDAEGGSLTQTDTASITIKCTGTATSDNDIIQDGMIIEFIK